MVQGSLAEQGTEAAEALAGCMMALARCMTA